MKGLVFASFFLAVSAFARPTVMHTYGDKPDYIPFIEEVATPESVIAELESCPLHSKAVRTSSNGIDFDQIINLGQKLWSIIEKNKPVQDVRYNYANALPRGAAATDLEAFSDLQFKTMRMWAKNSFGGTVYDIKYTLVHRYNGSLNGVGRYLENVTVLPHFVSTTWGYTTNLAVGGISTVNVGTKTAPVASLSMELNFKVSTVFKVIETHSLFGFRGDSEKVKSIDNSVEIE